jgi:predicted ATPase
MIKSRLDEINSKNTSLKIEAVFKGDKTSFKAYMKTMFQGSGIRDTNFSQLVEEFTDFGAMFRDMPTVKQKIGTSSDAFEQYFIKSLNSLLSYQVANKFTIKYKGKELEHHSPGQRASALILFVLSQQENDLVIIDQPEDDLDNQTIYDDVIKLIRELKSNHQFIFATHNANIPVLGDAEQICVCRYSDNKVQTNIGSIDNIDIQKDIIDIMEGGDAAFNRRKEVYEIWKYQS